ncbi:MAG: substrate-binding domain-containing protein [Blastomonas sp.]
MFKKFALACLPLVALSACQDPASSGDGASRSEIRIVGSSTVFPFAKAVAEQFANADPSRKSPILESTGTGGGMELFCNGTGAATPDIANASRRMKKAEFDRCAENGVTDIVELVVGIDGIAVAQSVKGKPLTLTTLDLYKALAANPFGADKNGTASWSDINAAYPAVKLNIYGPPSTSGTRDALTELIMEPGCKTDEKTAALKDSDKEKYEAVCHEVRTDGAYVDAGENDNLIIQKLAGNPDSVGIFGYSFLEENLSTVRGVPINGVEPTYDNIASGKYPGARPLYIYVKKAHLDVIPGLREYIAEFLGAGARDGYLVKAGLIASPDEERAATKAKFEALETLKGDDLK